VVSVEVAAIEGEYAAAAAAALVSWAATGCAIVTRSAANAMVEYLILNFTSQVQLSGPVVLSRLQFVKRNRLPIDSPDSSN
jgi:hypothetical protein